MLWWMLLSCAPEETGPSCAQLVEFLNPSIAGLSAMADYDGSDYVQGQRQLTRMKTRAEEAAEEARALSTSLPSEPIAAYAQDYAALCDRISEASGSLAEDLSQAIAVTEEATAAGESLQASIDGILSTCRQPEHSSECAPLIQALAELPPDFSDLEAMAAPLEGLRSASEATQGLGESAAQVADALEQAVSVHTRIQRIESTAASSYGALRAASEEQKQLVQAINQTCQEPFALP